MPSLVIRNKFQTRRSLLLEGSVFTNTLLNHHTMSHSLSFLSGIQRLEPNDRLELKLHEKGD